MLSMFIYIPFANCQESEVSKKINKSLDHIDYILIEYDINGAEYSQNFDYEMGHLHGQRAAYMHVLKMID